MAGSHNFIPVAFLSGKAVNMAMRALCMVIMRYDRL